MTGDGVSTKLPEVHLGTLCVQAQHKLMQIGSQNRNSVVVGFWPPTNSAAQSRSTVKDDIKSAKLRFIGGNVEVILGRRPQF